MWMWMWNQKHTLLDSDTYSKRVYVHCPKLNHELTHFEQTGNKFSLILQLSLALSPPTKLNLSMSYIHKYMDA